MGAKSNCGGVLQVRVDIANWRWYEAFCYYRISAILQVHVVPPAPAQDRSIGPGLASSLALWAQPQAAPATLHNLH